MTYQDHGYKGSSNSDGGIGGRDGVGEGTQNSARERSPYQRDWSGVSEADRRKDHAGYQRGNEPAQAQPKPASQQAVKPISEGGGGASAMLQAHPKPNVGYIRTKDLSDTLAGEKDSFFDSVFSSLAETLGGSRDIDR